MKTERGIWIGITAVLVAILLFMRFCGKPAEVVACPDPVKEVTRDTSFVTKDTTIFRTHLQPAVTIWDTLHIPDLATIDTAAILKDYYTTRVYLDSAETGYGQVYLEDSITRNQIKSRAWSFSLNVPVETIKETILVTPRPRGEIYVGVTGIGGKPGDLFGMGPSLVWRTRGNLQLEAGTIFTSRDGILYLGSLKYPLKRK